VPIMWYIQSEEMVIGSIFRRSLPQILLIAFFLLRGISLCAAGQRDDDPLRAAKEAYEAQNYNEAILLTAEVMKKHPERFDEAQSLINAIRAAKERYNRTFAELIELYQNSLESQDEEGLMESYTIIKELEDLDPFPSEKTEESLARAREATGNVFNRIRHSNIMDEGLARIIEEAYFEAVEIYLQGFDLALDIFRDKEYGPQPQAEADRIRGEAELEAREFIDRRESLDESTAFLSSVDSDTAVEELDPWLEGFFSAYAGLSALRGDIQTTLRGLEVLRLLILNEYAERGEDEIYHLAYLILLLRGRSGVEAETGLEEGILGALDGRWNSGVQRVVERLGVLFDTRYTTAEELFSRQEYAEADAAFGLAAEFAEKLQEAASVWRDQAVPIPADGEDPPDYEALAQAGDLPEYLMLYIDTVRFARAARQNAADSAALSRIGSRLETQDALLEEDGELAAENIQASRLVLGEIIGQVENLRQGILQRREDLPQEGDLREKAVRQLDQMDNRIALLEGFYRDSVESFTVLYARLNAAPLEERMSLLLELEARADESLEGESVIFQGNPFPARYPTAAAELYLSAIEGSRELLQENDLFLQELEGETGWLLEREEMAKYVEEARERSDTLRGLIARSSLNLEEAQTLVRQARQNRLDGERRYDEARIKVENRRFNLNNPNAVENDISDARDFFLTSLQREYLPLLDRRTDNTPGNSDAYDIQSLLSRLSQAKRDFYLPQREAAIAEARRLIRQQEFEEAGRSLNRAEDLHAQLDSEENPEIVRLQEFVDRAINTSSAWYISKTDPLYAEMSQLLNLARNDYLTARQRLDDGSSFGVPGLLRSAEEKLAAVQNTFPQNLEVGILALRIELLRTDNPAQRSAILAEKLGQAQSAFSAGDYQKALSLAKALQAIEPEYPGLGELIFEAEIATGQRVREPDPADVRAAEALYAEADSIWRNRIQDQYPAALDTIQRAIARYTPFNPPARYLDLKQELEIRVDTSAAAILSASDQLQYQSALEAYQQGNLVQAKLIVDQLIQKGDNARNPKLLDLQRRIESRL
jgi:hypothetical protein